MAGPPPEQGGVQLELPPPPQPHPDEAQVPIAPPSVYQGVDPIATAIPPIAPVVAVAAAAAPPPPPPPGPEPAEVPPVYIAPRGPLPPPRKVNGATDLLGAFNLVGLYKEHVRPFLRLRPSPAGVTPPAEEDKTDDRARFPRTWAHFVPDLPGRAGPSKAAARAARRAATTQPGTADDPLNQGLTPAQAAQQADADAGAWRAILFRPETTIRQPIPLENNLLDAFRVPAGPAIQPSHDTPAQERTRFLDRDRLLPDEPEEEPRRRRPKRKREDVQSNPAAPKRVKS